MNNINLNRGLKNVDCKCISFDSENPRGEKPNQITGDIGFRNLAASIAQFGILEPIIIKPCGNKKYVLIDGERRLRAALETNVETVPALIVDTDEDGRILAYQVHTLRKNWSKVAETKSIKKIIADIKSSNPSISDKTLFKKVKDATKHKGHSLTDIFILCQHDNDIIEAVIDNNLAMSYLVQNEKSFLNPCKNYFPTIVEKYTEPKLRRILAEKALSKLLVNTRYLMDYFRTVFKDDKNRAFVESLIIKFIENKKLGIDTVYEEYIAKTGASSTSTFKGKKNDKTTSPEDKNKDDTGSRDKDENETTNKDSDNSTKNKDENGTTNKGSDKSTKDKDDNKQPPKDDNFKDLNIPKKVQTTLNDIHHKFCEIGKTLSKEEEDYILEALECLKRFCFKAAVTMVWASGICRIIKYVEKNLADFNVGSAEMKKNPPSFCEYLAKNFNGSITDSSSLTEIRDKQFLSYITHRKFISPADFRKLINNYTTRCDCAHPSSIELGVNETIAIFENIYKFIFTNTNLK